MQLPDSPRWHEQTNHDILRFIVTHRPTIRTLTIIDWSRLFYADTPMQQLSRKADDTIQFLRYTCCLAAYNSCGRACQMNHFSLYKFFASVHTKKSTTTKLWASWMLVAQQLWIMSTLQGKAYSLTHGKSGIGQSPQGCFMDLINNHFYGFWKLYRSIGLSSSDSNSICTISFCLLLMGGNDQDLEEDIVVVSTMSNHCTTKFDGMAREDSECLQYRYHFFMLLTAMRRLVGLKQVNDTRKSHHCSYQATPVSEVEWEERAPHQYLKEPNVNDEAHPGGDNCVIAEQVYSP